VFTVSPKRADPAPGPRPAPELARYDKIHTERAGDSAPATPPAPAGTALGVLSAVLDHDGQQHSATQTREQHYKDLLQAALPQRWLVASFEHHCGPHGLPRPHIHNIVVALTSGV